VGARAVELSRLRLATSGSGPLPEDVAHQYHAVVGQRLLERYGTTESGLDVSNPYEGHRVAGQVGLPLPGVEIALVDPSGEIVEGGEVGEVLVRGPQVFSGYLGLPDPQQPFLAGWFRTGDLGVLDPETGYLRIVGRTKEVIITGGMNVYPREVEDVLLSHPDVEDVAVVGAKSSRWGEEVVAVVSPGDVDQVSLMRFAAGRLAPYKRPKRVVAIDMVPRNSVGKPDREAIVAFVSPVGDSLPPDGIGSQPNQP
jgi:malonyl-CoA/methylmalonyl-CoA synthetase